MIMLGRCYGLISSSACRVMAEHTASIYLNRVILIACHLPSQEMSMMLIAL